MNTRSSENARVSLPAGCATRALLSHITNKWGVLTLVALAGGTHRWSELLRSIEGISEKMLAQTLRTLVEDGFAVRDQKTLCRRTWNTP